MDAKPHRPPTRGVRIYDENMSSTTDAPTGKLLHQRTKSTSALGGLAAIHAKKVLADSNVNAKMVPKDDSEIGKKSPGKIRMSQEPAMPAPAAAAFHRPAARQLPLGSKIVAGPSSYAVTGVANVQAPAQVAEYQPTKKIIAKKSKVLRDVLPVQPSEAGANGAGAMEQQPTVADSAPLPVPVAVAQSGVDNPVAHHQEVHRVASVPLRHETAPRLQAQVEQPVNTMGLAAIIPTARQACFYPGPVAEIQSYTGYTTPVLADPHVYPASASSTNQHEFEEDFDDQDQDYMTAQSFDLRVEPTVTTIFNPEYTKKQDIEIAEAKAWVEQNRTPDDIEDEMWDTSMVAEYGEEIFEFMRKMETKMKPNPNYMQEQTEIQWSMRGVLMDWVVQVHARFNLLPETLFLTVNYIDRFLSCKVVSLGKLQLVGATAIFVAAKYEEVNCPTIAEIIYMVDNGYTAEELLKAERFMLSMLQFELGWPGPMSFLRRISKADDYDLETRTLAKYFLEVTIMDERFVGCKPSFLAAGAHCMARLMLRKGEWTKAHVYYSNYTFRQLHDLLGALFVCCDGGAEHHGAVFDKYTDKRYKRASVFVKGELQKGFQLPFKIRARSSVLESQNTGTIWMPQ